MNLDTYLKEKCALIERALDSLLPKEDNYPEVIYKAMRYSVIGGGKRLRPVLALASCEAVGGDPSAALTAGCALEFIHAYSLIHDDLPAMDNDDLRRGKPTNHKVFGEATAILAGDALLTYAFQTLTQMKGAPEIVLEVSNIIARAAGTEGMVAGQVADIISEGERVGPDVMEFIHRHKTGALIKVACTAGGLLGGGTREEVESLGLYGEKIGLAFQITDDILDMVGSEEKLGKPIGSDTEQNKSTYPVLFGLQRASQLAHQAVEEALSALEPLGPRANPLREIARFILEREY
ncbi:MAG TPA: geranyl transferase [Armatimonadetes bacterium]|mgnify:CR=1 FL=1|nr:geranyl transferase [Armatimonadota bacterium]